VCSRKADISALDKYSFTPLMMAAYKGHIEAFQALLELKANIDDVEENNKTVVHLAAEQNHSVLLDVRIIIMIHSLHEHFNNHVRVIRDSLCCRKYSKSLKVLS